MNNNYNFKFNKFFGLFHLQNKRNQDYAIIDYVLNCNNPKLDTNVEYPLAISYDTLNKVALVHWRTRAEFAKINLDNSCKTIVLYHLTIGQFQALSVHSFPEFGFPHSWLNHEYI